MAHFIIVGITCHEPYQLHEDEIFLRIIYDRWDTNTDEPIERTYETDTNDFEEGDSRNFNGESIQFHSYARVQLFESHSTGNHRYLGQFQVGTSHNGLGELSERIEKGKGDYTIYYEVAEETPPQNFRIRINGLRCADAKDSTDRISLTINGETVWGGKDNKWNTNEDREITGVQRNFHRNVFVELFEHAGIGTKTDSLGRLTLTRAEVREKLRERHNHQHRFHADEGFSGDATYYLRYSLYEY